MAAKKKSEVRKHTSMMRMDKDVLVLVRKAAALMGVSLADYASVALRTAANRDLRREGAKLAGKGGDE